MCWWRGRTERGRADEEQKEKEDGTTQQSAGGQENIKSKETDDPTPATQTSGEENAVTGDNIKISVRQWLVFT